MSWIALQHRSAVQEILLAAPYRHRPTPRTATLGVCRACSRRGACSAAGRPGLQYILMQLLVSS